MSSPPEPPDQRRLAWLFGLFLLSALLLIRIHGPRVFFVATGDDEVYYAHARSIALTHNFRYAQVPLETFGAMADGRVHAARYSIGPGILLSPFLFTGHVLARIFEPASTARTLGITATHFLSVSCGSILLGLAGMCFLYLYLRHFVSSEASFWAVFLMTLSSPLPYYLFRRPIMAHSAEFFSLSAALYGAALLKWDSRPLPIVLAGISCGFIFLSRWLDFPYVIAISLYAFAALRRPTDPVYRIPRAPLLYAAAVTATAGVQLIFWQMLTGDWNPGLGKLHPGAAGDSLLFTVHPWVLKHLTHIFIGPDWGILRLSPAIVLTLVLLPLAWKGNLVRNTGWFLLFPSLAILWMTANWVTHGAEYAHRYLIPLWIFFSVLLAGALHWLRESAFAKTLIAVKTTGILCVIYSLFMLSLFKSNTTTLTLHIGKSPYGNGADWVNPAYAANALDVLIHHPFEAMLSFGPSLAGYGAFFVFQKLHLLPAALQSKAGAYILKHGMPNCYNSALILMWIVVGSVLLYLLFRRLSRRHYLV